MTKVVSVLSGKGGTGKTTVSINLSFALKHLGQKVVLVDGNVTMPHVSTYLGINSWKFTLNDFLSGKTFDRDALINYNGIKVLISSPILDDLVGVDLKRMKKIIENIESTEKPDFIIIDGPPGIGKETISLIELSDEILLVVQPFEQHLIDAVKIKEIVNSMSKSKIKVVLNNGFWLPDKKIREIEKILKTEVIGFVPNDKSLMFSLINKTPILEENPKSFISEFFFEIGCSLCNEEFRPSWRFKLFKILKNFGSYL